VVERSKVERFEDLMVWQKARGLTKEIYTMTSRGQFARDFGLSQQIQRACVSIMSNLAEGFERGGRAEFHQFIVVSKASCAEVRCQLYVALDVGYINQLEFDALKSKAEEISKLLSRLKSSVASQLKQK
jgi:four helix bundle protein